jgi:hypothetical protein
MIGLYLIFLLCILVYFRFVREGYITLTSTFPIDPDKAMIENDLVSLNSGERLIYIIYKSKAGEEVQSSIETQIMRLYRPREYKVVRLFSVADEKTATALFYFFYNQPIRYDTITVLTNNIGTTQSGNVKLINFVNTDSDFFRSIQSIITKNNVV